MLPKLYPDLQKLIYPTLETQYSRYPSSDQFQSQCLYQAIFEGNGENVALRLSADNVNTSYGDYRITPLHVAAHENQIEIADDLLENEADVTLVDAEGRTPLHVAAYCGHEQMTRYLAENSDVDVQAKTKGGQTALDIAREQGHLSICLILQIEEQTPNQILPEKLARPWARELGKGTHATVYEECWETEGRKQKVAVKIYNKQSHNAPSLFNREARMLTRLNPHPNIVTLYGTCRRNGYYCLVMELMPEGDLWAVLRNMSSKKESLSLSLILQIALDIVNGLMHAHSLEVLHRDIKSLNVLLDDRLRAKLADFGLAKAGTASWRSPELFEGEQPTKASDVYAFGMVFWELVCQSLTGTSKWPFKNWVESRTSTTVINGGRETIPSGCDPKHEEIIYSCWEQNPRYRPSAADLVTTLSDWQEQQKTAASAQSPTLQLSLS